MKIELSVVIPAFNESEYIAKCIDSIQRNCIKYGVNVEIIVVDNGSTDDTASIAKEHTAQVYSIDRGSVSRARNYGVRKSSFPIIAFIDGDTTITSKWVECFVEHYESFISQPLFLTGSQCIVPEDGSWIELHWFKHIRHQLLGGANILTSRKAFDLILGFDESLKTGEDCDFCVRSIEAGINYHTDDGLEAVHLGYPHTLKGFIRRECWHGEGDFQSLKRFFDSPVAVIATAMLLAQIAVIIGLFLQAYQLAFVLAAGVLLVNAAITFKRFRNTSLITQLINSVINYFYFMARSMSIFRMIANRKNSF